MQLKHFLGVNKGDLLLKLKHEEKMCDYLL